MNNSELIRIIEKHKGKTGELLAILQDIQLAFGYLSEQSLRTVANITNRSLVDIYGFASLYKSFRLKSSNTCMNKPKKS